MERIITKNKNGDIACNNIIIYTSKDKSEIGKSIRDSILTDFEIIEPKYFRYRDDNSIVEVWYDRKGIILSGNIKGYISKSFATELIEKITYEEAMHALEQQQGLNKNLGYNNKDLMSKVITNGATAGLDYARDDLIDIMAFNKYENDMTKSIEESKGNLCYEITAPDIKQNNNGGASDWYSLPKNANTLQDLIEHRNMNGSVKDIFKACYRLGIKTEDELRDLNKMAYYSLREVGRITGRKDYITIAKELMGSQANEKDENDI